MQYFSSQADCSARTCSKLSLALYPWASCGKRTILTVAPCPLRAWKNRSVCTSTKKTRLLNVSVCCLTSTRSCCSEYEASEENGCLLNSCQGRLHCLGGVDRCTENSGPKNLIGNVPGLFLWRLKNKNLNRKCAGVVVVLAVHQKDGRLDFVCFQERAHCQIDLRRLPQRSFFRLHQPGTCTKGSRDTSIQEALSRLTLAEGLRYLET